MKYDLIIIRYGELSLKSKYVRNQFESKLIENIKHVFRSNNIQCKIQKERGRIYLYTDKISNGLEILQKIFGITSISPAIETKTDMYDISQYAVKISKKMIGKKDSFALRVTRSGQHDFTSQDVAIKVGNDVAKETQARVDLDSPDFELFIEIRGSRSFLFTEKVRGVSGLPLGTQGNILALIDNPKSILAAWYLMHRGCEIFFVTTDRKNVDYLDSFARNWYITSDITMINAKEKNLYDALNKIAFEKGCDAIVTAHSLYNIPRNSVSDIKLFKKHIKLPILNPLIAMEQSAIDKKCNEIGIPI